MEVAFACSYIICQPGIWQSSSLSTWSKEYATKSGKDAALWVCRLIGILAAGQTDADSGKSRTVSGKIFPKIGLDACFNLVSTP